jgi:DNA end-binding protein Ku
LKSASSSCRFTASQLQFKEVAGGEHRNMAARSTWKGYLKLSLVSIPVKAYSISSGEGAPIRLNQLHAECKSRIKNVKTCPIHGEVKSDDIVSGYEYAKDHYVIINLDEISKLRVEDEKGITITEFIKPDALDPIYWNGSTLFLLPDSPVGQKPYALLHAGMIERNRYAMAQVVWHGKEYVVLIRPMGALLAMCILSYAHDISSPATLEPELVKTEMVPRALADRSSGAWSTIKTMPECVETEPHSTRP